MGLQKVKEVLGASAQKGADAKARRENGAEWSRRFLELLVRETERKEQQAARETQTGKRAQNQEKREGYTEDDDTFDCRIVTKGTEEVPADWDSFEVTRDFREPVLTSELYVDIIDKVKAVGNWRADILYKIACAILQDYYADALDMHAVLELFWGCYQKCVEKKKTGAVPKQRRQKILETLYEYFVRVNARKSVAANEREGRRLVEGCGLSWAGTTYYAARYYETCEKMRRMFQVKCREIARKEGLCEIAFAQIEAQTQFLHVGGLTFHSVFVWIQQKDNHPAEQYGMRDITRVPPQNFGYLYRNHFAEDERSRILLLEKRMRECAQNAGLWRSFTLEDGREYHNGMSYLLEGSIMDAQEEAVYEETMAFLQNFRVYRIAGCVEFLFAGTRQ